MSFFLSHQWAQKPYVEAVARALTSHGLSYWLDTERMPTGTILRREIAQGVDAASAVLVFLSPDTWPARTATWSCTWRTPTTSRSLC